jgi:hypothetical protein
VSSRPVAKTWITAFLIGCLLLPGLSVRPAAAQSSKREYAIKAAFVYNFLKFIDWPSGGNRPLVVGVFGSNPFGSALTNLNGKTAKGRTISVRQINGVADAESCDVLFIPASEADRQQQLLQAVRGSSVLTIGERRGFAQSGGVINFVVEDDKVRFEVNPAAAERAKLSIGSEMLKLAKIVRS